jgi:hypothetical protein
MNEIKTKVESIYIYLEQSSLSVEEISKRLDIKLCKINDILYGNAWIDISCKYDFSNRGHNFNFHSWTFNDYRNHIIREILMKRRE